MSELELFARLEEKGYKRWEIERLDPWWVVNVIFYPRDKGQFVPRAAPHQEPPPSEQQRFQRYYKRRGYPDWKIQELWSAAMKVRRGKASKRKGRSVRKR